MAVDMSDMIINKVICIVSGYNKAGVSMFRRSRPCSALVLKYEGKTVYRSGGVETVSDASSAVFLSKGIDYEWECVEAGHYITVEFECSKQFTQIISFASVDCARLLQSIKRAEAARGLKRMSEVYGIFAGLLEKDSAYVPSKSAEILRPALEAVNANPLDVPSVSELAAMCGISEVYLRRLFSEVVGMPLGKYIQSLKIKRAEALLSADYGSIADVATSLGYSDVFSFSKAFRRCTGTTPAKFAKNAIDFSSASDKIGSMYKDK